MNDIGRAQTGNPSASVVPSGAKQHDIDCMLSEPTPVPLEEVELSENDLRVLGYFCRDLTELCESAFMEDGPGSLTSVGGSEPVLETAISDDEIRSFVTIFRRLYMTRGDQANFIKAVAVFTGSLGDHRYSKWVDGVRSEYESHLNSTVELRPFVQPGQCNFTTKRLNAPVELFS